MGDTDPYELRMNWIIPILLNRDFSAVPRALEWWKRILLDKFCTC